MAQKRHIMNDPVIQLSSNEFVLSMQRFFQNVYQLLIKEQIAINIKVSFTKSTKFEEAHLKLVQQSFASYFDENKVLQFYKQPKCSNTMICVPFVKPQIVFDTTNKTTCIIQVSNAGISIVI